MVLGAVSVGGFYNALALLVAHIHPIYDALSPRGTLAQSDQWGNSGAALTREHVRSINGYIVVDPRARLTEAMAK